jgi:hypothetical protein
VADPPPDYRYEDPTDLPYDKLCPQCQRMVPVLLADADGKQCCGLCAIEQHNKLTEKIDQFQGMLDDPDFNGESAWVTQQLTRYMDTLNREWPRTEQSDAMLAECEEFLSVARSAKRLKQFFMGEGQ